MLQTINTIVTTIGKLTAFLAALTSVGIVPAKTIAQVNLAIAAANALLQQVLGLHKPTGVTDAITELEQLVAAIESTGVVPADAHLADAQAFLKKFGAAAASLDAGQPVVTFTFTNPDNGRKVLNVLVEDGTDYAGALGYNGPGVAH